MIIEKEILIDNFRNIAIRYINSGGYVNNLFFNYVNSEFSQTLKVRDFFVKNISFSNYKNDLRQVVLREDGKIYYNS